MPAVCDAESPQGHLWDAAGYDYAAYVTDVDWVPEDVVAFHNKREGMEKAIHELKEDFGIDRVASSSFGANPADLTLKVLAFNLLVLYHGRPWAGRSSSGRRRSGAGSRSPVSSSAPPGSWDSSWSRRGPARPTWCGSANARQLFNTLRNRGSVVRLRG